MRSPVIYLVRSVRFNSGRYLSSSTKLRSEGRTTWADRCSSGPVQPRLERAALRVYVYAVTSGQSSPYIQHRGPLHQPREDQVCDEDDHLCFAHAEPSARSACRVTRLRRKCEIGALPLGLWFCLASKKRTIQGVTSRL